MNARPTRCTWSTSPEKRLRTSRRQIGSIDLGCRLTAYCSGQFGLGQLSRWPLKTECGCGQVWRQFEILETQFYTLDLLVGFALPVFIHLQNRNRPDGSVVIRLFWLGVAIGLTWEIPIFLSAIFATNPIVGFLREPPLHPAVFMVAHSFWDGGLFLAGLALVRALCAHPVLVAFRWQELGVLILWGQLSALAVEIVSVINRGWVYSGLHSWNPVLFQVADHPITVIPQLIWLGAPVVYYLGALGLARLDSINRRSS
jgi:hypothetical protein